MKELYTIDDIATMTILSTRTIRNYIFVKQSIKTKINGLVYDYILNDNKTKNSVCSIYDYPVENPIEAKSLCNNIIKKINSNEYGEIKFSYNHEKT